MVFSNGRETGNEWMCVATKYSTVTAWLGRGDESRERQKTKGRIAMQVVRSSQTSPWSRLLADVGNHVGNRQTPKIGEGAGSAL